MLVDFTHKYNVFVFSTDTRFSNFHLPFEQARFFITIGFAYYNLNKVNKKSKNPSKCFIKQLVFQIYTEGNFGSNEPTIKKLGELIDRFHQQVVVLRFSSMQWYCVTFLTSHSKVKSVGKFIKA